MDSIPPKVVKEVPLNGSVNYTGKKIEVQFDEYIQLDNVMQHLLVCPPQQTPPEINAIGKSLKVEFKQPIQDSTTYTLDFGSAICDYHEKNPLRNYLFAFSSGPVIDTLEVAGLLVNAEDLNPISGVCVGLQRVLEDSALTSLPLNRISRTDSVGGFRIRNIHEGCYRLYGIGDVNRDYLYSPGEGLAWSNDTVCPDTTVQHYVLWYSQDSRRRQYMQRAKRETANKLVITFSAPMDSMPLLIPEDSTLMDRAYLQRSSGKDTIILWLKDSADMQLDTLRLQLTYYKTDSLMALIKTIDTLAVSYRVPQMNERAMQAKQKKEAARRLKVTSNASDHMDVWDTLCICSDYPLDTLCAEKVHLYIKKDTVRTLVSCHVMAADGANMRYHVLPEQWQQGAEYELRVDSAAMLDIYGVGNESKQFGVKRKSPSDYATLTIVMVHPEDGMRLQLLTDKDVVLRDVPVKQGRVVLRNLSPVSYYLRMYIDRNADGRWTAGSWSEKLQPEPVYYFPSKLTLKANWEFEEKFDHTQKPQLESKPREICKDANGKKK